MLCPVLAARARRALRFRVQLAVIWESSQSCDMSPMILVGNRQTLNKGALTRCQSSKPTLWCLRTVRKKWDRVLPPFTETRNSCLFHYASEVCLFSQSSLMAPPLLTDVQEPQETMSCDTIRPGHTRLDGNSPPHTPSLKVSHRASSSMPALAHV